MDWTEPSWILGLKVRFPRLFKGIAPFNFAVGEGWERIIADLCERLDAVGPHRLTIVQIKEKFGGLRVYTEHSNDEVSRQIRIAEEAASVTCEGCGAPGRLADLATLCNSCRAELKSRWEE